MLHLQSWYNSGMDYPKDLRRVIVDTNGKAIGFSLHSVGSYMSYGDWIEESIHPVDSLDELKDTMLKREQVTIEYYEQGKHVMNVAAFIVSLNRSGYDYGTVEFVLQGKPVLV